ncbi:hypothetical protein LCGC14_2251120, partial [marine sediment metagenome]
MKTLVNYLISVAVVLSVGCLPSSVDQQRDVAFWHVKHTPDSILISYYRFIDDFNAQLNSLSDPTLSSIALTAVTAVTDTGGEAEFQISGTIPEVGQRVILSGFTTETSYNQTILVTV